MLKIIIFLLLNTTIYANDFLYFFNKTQSFSADFVQEVNGKQTNGKLLFSRPKSLKWHTTAPEESIIMLHNDVVTKYDVWIRSANVVPYTHNELIEYLTTATKHLTQKPTLVASKDKIKYYQLGNVYFGFTHQVLSEIIITNELKQKIHVSLTNVIINEDITKEFTIKFADNVDILDETRSFRF